MKKEWHATKRYEIQSTQREILCWLVGGGELWKQLASNPAHAPGKRERAKGKATKQDTSSHLPTLSDSMQPPSCNKNKSKDTVQNSKQRKRKVQSVVCSVQSRERLKRAKVLLFLDGWDEVANRWMDGWSPFKPKERTSVCVWIRKREHKQI